MKKGDTFTEYQYHYRHRGDDFWSPTLFTHVVEHRGQRTYCPSLERAQAERCTIRRGSPVGAAEVRIYVRDVLRASEG